jgi:hypothetical protein
MLARAVSAAVTFIAFAALLPSTVAAAGPGQPLGSVDQDLPAAVTPAVGSASAAQRQIALGVAELPATGSVYSSLKPVDAFTKSVGHHSPAIWTIWRDWMPAPAPNTRFPVKSFLDGLYNRHIVPMINWAPDDPNHKTQNRVPYQGIANGDFDAYIRNWARQAKAYGHTVIIRFAQEMDGHWMPWQVGKYGNTAANFKAAWHRIWQIFKGPKGVGATNVRFLWSPFHPDATTAKLYPGDSFVDYVGFTGLNWNTANRPWQSMKDLYSKPMQALSQLTKKPVIVAEAGTVASAKQPSRKPAWITKGYPTVYATYPRIVAIVYFDIKVPQQVDWRLVSPAAALSAYIKVLSDTRFQGRLS